MNPNKVKRDHDQKDIVEKDHRRLKFLCSALAACILLIFVSNRAKRQTDFRREPGRELFHISGFHFNSGTENVPPDWENLLVDDSTTYHNKLEQLLILNVTDESGCCNTRTASVSLEGLPESHDQQGTVVFSADRTHTLTLVAFGPDGTRRCAGGDYFETDFHDASNVTYRSRLPTVDYGNGTYGLELMVPSRFAGSFVLHIFLLFGNWHGLDPEIDTSKESDVPILTQRLLIKRSRGRFKCFDRCGSLTQCEQRDFDRTSWQGRWTRTWFNDSCKPDFEKRYRCLPKDRFYCEEPWCYGPLGRLESNGWSYSAHCSFKLYEAEEAWKCLNGRWILLWGDCNFQDTMRNMLLFILDWKFPPGESISEFHLNRTYEATFENPANSSESLRVSMLFNGANETAGNYEGLFTLTYEQHRKQLLQHFTGEKKPDVLVMTSGLHDLFRFKTVGEYAAAVDYTIEWWLALYKTLPAEERPKMIWKTTVAPVSDSKRMPENANKAEMFNLVTVEKFRRARDDGFPVKIIDAFDLTFPFHYNNEYSDGGHYGRAPGLDRSPWFGKPHWYFVDVMLANIWLNAICPKS